MQFLEIIVDKIFNTGIHHNSNVFTYLFPQQIANIVELIFLLILLMSASRTFKMKNGALKLFIFMLFPFIIYLIGNYIMSLSNIIVDGLKIAHFPRIIGGILTTAGVITSIIAVAKLSSGEIKDEFKMLNKK